MFKFTFSVKSEVRRGKETSSAEKEWSSLGEEDVLTLAGQASLPREFRKPQEFRTKMEGEGGPIPAWPLPAPMVFAILLSAMVWWCYYGYEYNQKKFPVSLTALVVFFAVFLALFVTTMFLRELHRRRRMYPVLKRLADQRPGAFLVLAGKSPMLFYATDRWIGRVDFEEGGEDEDPFTLLEARLRQPAGRLEIRNKRILEKLIPEVDRQVVSLAESIFNRKFVVSSPEPEASRKFLDATVVEAVMRLSQLGDLLVHIDRGLVRVKVRKDLGVPRREHALGTFLAGAEVIVEAAARRASVPVDRKPGS